MDCGERPAVSLLRVGGLAEDVMRIEYLKGINNGPYKGSHQIPIVQFF